MTHKKASNLLASVLATAFLSGCSGFKSENSTIFEGGRSSNDNPGQESIIPLPTGGNIPAPAGNEDVEAIPGQKTVAVVSANRALMNMINCLGTESPTEGAQAAQAVWEEKKGSFSVEGKANTVTPPMLMAQASVAAEVCIDAIRIESGQASNQRRLFPLINFNSGPNSVGQNALNDVVRRIARSCWGRNETDEERNMIVSQASSSFSGNSTDETRRQVLYVCASMMSSTSGMEL